MMKSEERNLLDNNCNIFNVAIMTLNVYSGYFSGSRKPDAFLRLLKLRSGLMRFVMETEMSVCSVHRHRDENDLETRGIWEDAGFKPPQFYLQLVEFLHLSYLNGGYVPVSCFEATFEDIHSPSDTGSFEINDRERMFRFAESMGIDDFKGDDDRIAAGITLSIISDYILPGDIPSATEKMNFSH